MNDDHIKTIVELRAEINRLRALRSNALTGYLTDSKIAKLTKHWTRDCTNLFIQVQNPGSRRRSWIFRYKSRVDGKMHNLGLGSYPTISIDQARELALHYRQMLLEGKEDPKEVRKANKLKILIARGLVKSVREVAIEWYENKIAKKKPRLSRQNFQPTQQVCVFHNRRPADPERHHRAHSQNKTIRQPSRSRTRGIVGPDKPNRT
jgi:hypothetical protein